MSVTLVPDAVASMASVTITDGQNIHYRSTAVGDLGRFLGAICTQKDVAPLVTKFVLDGRYDDFPDSGVLEFGDEAYGFRRTIRHMTAQPEHVSDVGIEVDEDDGFSDSESEASTDFDSDWETDSDFDVVSTGPEHPFQIAFEDLAITMVGSDLDEPTPRLYFYLIAAILSVFSNIECLYIPRAWSPEMAAWKLGERRTVGVTGECGVLFATVDDLSR